MDYAKHYGPSYRKAPPDMSRCAKSVSSDGWGFSQCQRRAVCDPDSGGEFTTCKQHSETATAERAAKQKAAYDAENAKWQLKFAAPKMKAALEQIAAGHNNPRALASQVLEGMQS